MVIYAEEIYDKIESKTNPVPRRGILQIAPGQGADGYGRRISTDYMVRFNDEKKWRRVYCCCFSNAGTLYAEVNGQWVCFHGDDYLRTNGAWPQDHLDFWHKNRNGATAP